mgnify:CR=1 FL=1
MDNFHVGLFLSHFIVREIPVIALHSHKNYKTRLFDNTII